MASESLSVKISANASGFMSACDAMVNELEEVSRKFESLNKIGEGFKSVGKQMTAVGVGIIASMGGIVAKGSEWQANTEATEYLYKNLDKSVQKSIATNEKNAKSLGMTSKQYKENATDMANFYKNMDLTTESTSKLTESTMTLASDLAAFSDLPINDVMGDMKSAMLGNFEVMDKYGVSLSVAKVNSGEYAKSIGKTWEKMTEAEKVQAIYNETLAQTSGITGLGAQEADGFASRINILKDNISNLVGQIGASLLPTLEPLVAKFTEVVEKVTAWVQANPELTSKILTVVGAIGVLAATLGPLLIFIGSVITSFSAISGAITAVSGAFALLSGPVLIVIGVLTTLIAVGVAVYKNWDTIKAYASSIWNTIKTAILNVAKAIGDGLKKDFENAKTVILNAWNTIKSAASTVWNAIKSVVIAVVGAIVNKVKTDFEQAKTAVTTVWNAIKTATSTVWNAIKSAVTTVVNAVKSTITTVFNSVSSVVSTAWNNVKSVTSSVWNGIKSTVSSVVNGIKSTISSAFSAVKSTVSSIWNSIKSAITNPINQAKSAVSSAMSAIKSAVNVSLKPNLKLPHISVSGKLSLDPPSVPKISVSWYKNGGIMTQPTLFGLAGGEAGPEAILPLKGFYSHLDEKLEGNIDYARLEQIMDRVVQKAGASIYLDGNTLVGGIVGKTERQMGNRISLSERGLIL